MGHGLQFEKHCFRLRMWHIVHETEENQQNLAVWGLFVSGRSVENLFFLTFLPACSRLQPLS